MKHLAVRLSLLLCLLYAAPFFAQTADVSGAVIDQLGAVVSGAKVRLVNQGTLIERSFTTNPQGVFSAPFVSPGLYQVIVEAQGFSTEAIRDIKVDVGAQVNIPIHLRVGPQDTTVKVDGSGLILNTVDASVSTVIDRNFVQNIPLNGRSFQDLISMTPGVVTQSPQSNSSLGLNGDFSVNGQRTESNYYMVDGVSANISAGAAGGAPQAATGGTMAAATALGTTQSLVSVDALQEFRVESSTYSAEYGRNPGGQFSLVTRSGSNDLHGSVFEYLRNNFFDANDWFNDHYGVAISALRQNDFGGTFGGPIVLPRLYSGKNESFLFVSYEGLRLVQPQAASIQYVPDTSLRQDAPMTTQPILNSFPLPSPGGIDYSDGLAQFISSYSLPSQIDSTSIRLDHVITPKLSLFFRVGYTPSFSATRTLSSLTRQNIDTQTYTLGATSQLSTHLTNEFRLGLAKSNSSEVTMIDSFGGAQPTDFPGAFGVGSFPNASSAFELQFAGVGRSLLDAGKGSNQGRQWNLTDTFGIARGRHQIKIGADYRRIESTLSPSSPYISAFYLSAQSVLSNDPDSLENIVTKSALPIFNETSVFVQDEWRVNQKLSLSYGLRWENDPPPNPTPYTTAGNISDPNSLTLAPPGTPLWKSSWYNFAPRLGFAWTANTRSGWETVVRAGGGVFYDTNNEEATQGFDTTGFASNQSLTGSPLPLSPSQLNLSTIPTAPYGVVVAFPNHLQLPYTLQWNTSIQQAFASTQSVTISYVGSNGRRQTQFLIIPLAGNPTIENLELYAGGVTSNYQALQAKFERYTGHGLHALASYTWSHSIDFGSNSGNLVETRGNSDFDVRHNFQAGLSWDVPALSGNRFVGSLLDHWGFDARVLARTGFPITLEGNSLVDPVTGSYYNGNVDLVPGQPIYLYGDKYPGGRILNAAAFDTPSGNGVGTAARNFVRGFGEFQSNIAARRQFHLYEHATLQFRAEAFNIFNHPNFGYVDPYLIDATFGQATQMLNRSLGTVAAQYQQGGPRSLQFALHVAF